MTALLDYRPSRTSRPSWRVYAYELAYAAAMVAAIEWAVRWVP